MQDNDFDKIFNHKFGQLPGEPYSEENWSELSHRINIHERRQRRWMLPVLLPLFALLGAGNLFWWYQWREATKYLHTTAKQTILYQTDTIVSTSVVYRYDTIYQNITLAKRHIANVHRSFAGSAGQSEPAPVNTFSGNYSDTTAHPSALYPIAIGSLAGQNLQGSVKQQITNGDAAAPTQAIVHMTPGDTSELTTPPPPSDDNAKDTLFENLLKQSPLPIPKVQSPFLYVARPRLGLSAAWGLPGFPHKRSGFILGGGIRADVEIARNFRLGAEVAYQQASAKGDETEVLDALEVDIPDPGGDFKLKYWDVYSLPTFSYTLHLRYNIPLRGKWTPWLGVGGQVLTYLPFDIEYEFENDNNELELHAPANALSGTGWHGTIFLFGADYRLNPRLYFGIEGFLLRSFKEEPGMLDRQLGLKTSLSYKF
ncbi:MAG: hypothetical protein EPGJADBJ_03712 [Saprospiraceae bacterium]|nr:hypothetical protein [Saprospiraceae bacterium]